MFSTAIYSGALTLHRGDGVRLYCRDIPLVRQCPKIKTGNYIAHFTSATNGRPRPPITIGIVLLSTASAQATSASVYDPCRLGRDALWRRLARPTGLTRYTPVQYDSQVARVAVGQSVNTMGIDTGRYPDEGATSRSANEAATGGIGRGSAADPYVTSFATRARAQSWLIANDGWLSVSFRF
jgi:hypothetical protein